ncbi:MAG TPA: hypothetical protein VNW29_08010 [Candidatus Sulfotelmatobacter sp.]|nr:hypothetical protein [Candidatus Sulfotelmatobacter sp.]
MSIKNKNQKTSLLGDLTEKSSFEEIRQYLIGKNFVMNTIFTELKNNVALLATLPKPNVWKDENKKLVLKLNELSNLYEKNLFFGGSEFHKNSEDVVLVDNEIDDVPVLTPGAYIRFNPTMTQQAWLERYKQAQFWAKETQIYQQIPKDFDGRRKKIKQRIQVGKKDIEQNILMYLQIEERLPRLWQLKQSEAGYSLIDGAIEEILSDKEYDKLNDTELNALKKKYQTIYYDVIERYHLLLPTELPKYLKIISDLLVKPS